GLPKMRSRKVAIQLTERGETPLEVMAGNYLYFDRKAKSLEAELDALGPNNRIERTRLLADIKGYRLCSQSCARDASVYMHPRLSAAWIRRDSANGPVTVVGKEGESHERMLARTRAQSGQLVQGLEESQLCRDEA